MFHFHPYLMGVNDVNGFVLRTPVAIKKVVNVDENDIWKSISVQAHQREWCNIKVEGAARYYQKPISSAAYWPALTEVHYLLERNNLILY